MTEKRLLPVMEIFGPTVQGEGALCGQVSHFVRFGGCGYRCTWCDSMHAVDPHLVKANARRMTVEQIASEVLNLPLSRWVTLSGGDPLMHDLEDLICMLHQGGFKVAIETQGQFFRQWALRADLLTISPKGPSSGMSDKLDFVTLSRYAVDAHTLDCDLAFKVVVFNTEDLHFAKVIHERYPNVKMYLSAGTPTDDAGMKDDSEVKGEVLASYKWLVDQVLHTPAFVNCVVLPQLHVLVWAHKKGV